MAIEYQMQLFSERGRDLRQRKVTSELDGKKRSRTALYNEI